MRRAYLFLPLVLLLASCKPETATAPSASTAPANTQPAAPEPIDGSKLIGVWKFKKAAEAYFAPFNLEFLKDGKLQMTMQSDGKESKSEGQYTLKGNELKMDMPSGPKGPNSRTVEILKLNDEVLIFEQDKIKMEFRRVKPGS
ncbi:MAG TPA: hypothetical protein VKS79_26900 [Gemmataceae bacterium]|nr:hypothetical protein [Gemmataceae bacterium]